MSADRALSAVPHDRARLEHGHEEVVQLEPIEERLAELEQLGLRTR